MEIDHDLVVVDEFDALAIEVRVPPKDSTGSSSPSPHEHDVAETAADEKKTTRKLKQTPEAALFKKKYGKYPAKGHAEKVARELGVNKGFVYLPGQVERLHEDSDMGPEFRQRRYFYYLSGAWFAGCAVTYDIGKDELILWIPHVDAKETLWYGTRPSIDECKAAVVADDVRHITGLNRFLYQHLIPGATLYVLHPDQAPRLGNTKGMVSIDTAKLGPAMDAARVIKTEYEVAMIRRANLISSGAHRAVQARLRGFANERELDAVFRGYCTAHGAAHQAYAVIAGSGPNAATLHYVANKAPLAGRQLVVLDAGAEWKCYASDITRTLPVGGVFSPEAKAVHDLVSRMQDECIRRIKPGLVFYTLHVHACMVAVTELLRLRILHNGSPADILSRGTVAAFFPHGLGHHVGLEVHDVSGRESLLLGSTMGAPVAKTLPQGQCMPGKRHCLDPDVLASLYRDAVKTPPSYQGRQKLAPNMVVTVEPGIYFCRDYIKAYFLDDPLHAKYINTAELEKYFQLGGARIEDCILVTEDGYENLTTAPKGEEMLKVINGSQ